MLKSNDTFIELINEEKNEIQIIYFLSAIL